MSDLRTEAIKMALKFIVLLSSKDRAWFTEKEFEVVAALRKALAQPEHTAWVTAGEHTVPLKTYPPKHEWVGLTDDELPQGETYEFDRGVRWAEQILKEKNIC